MVELPVEIASTLVGFAGAAAGYALREYGNRVTPFFNVLRIDGTKKLADVVPVPDHITKATAESFYIGRLLPQSTLNQINSAWDRADDLTQLWPTVKEEIQKAITATTDDELCSCLAALFRSEYFDRWMMKLLLNSKLDFLLDDTVLQAPESLHAWIEEDQDEMVWFDFPSGAVSFGQKLGHPAIKAKMMPLIIAVTRLHKPGLRQALTQFVSLFDQDHHKALSCVHELRNINNMNSRWAFRCFLANTGEHPLLVQNSGSVRIVDPKAGTKFSPECYLVLTNENDEFTDTTVPLIVDPGKGVQFLMVTKEKQKDMELGSALREVFERGDASCQVRIPIRKVGLVKRQTIKSSSTRFAQQS